MHIIKRQALVPFSAEQMYQLVDAIEEYPQFLPWCHKTVVHHRSDNQVEASIAIASMGIEKSFTTRNSLTPFSRIDLALVDGPFKKLEGCWQFHTVGDLGCRVELLLEYDYASGWAHLAFGPFFTHAANHLVDAFYERAKAVYGKP